ncbi:MAG: Xaa-Pro dipeptidase [Gammaproteobacteria bacterium]|nr:Xaa-Pro dipeptidase [Gammaproteobacteria bacterium]MBU6509486.1 Xaa-Pro dipeptidase [Gammaproteobacteria bacterium]MDE2108652.1 Xaa-Pro dipeptidase [Gammaproteobacteria bacterium]
MNRVAQTYPEHLETVKKRFGMALAAAGFDAIAIFAGSLQGLFLDDQDYPFRVNPHFKNWLPLLQAHDSFVAYVPGQKPVLVYYQPDDYWCLPPAPPSGFWVEHFDIRIIKRPEDAPGALPVTRRCVFLGEWQERFKNWGFADVNPEALINPLHYTRAAKTEYELECMREASALSARGHRAAEQAFRAGASEFEIHTAFCAACGQTDNELPYGAIIALNEHAATLHYQYWNRDKPARRHSFLIDAAAQVNGYAADVTRSYSAAGDEFQELIDALDKEQQLLARKVRAETDFKALHLETHQAIARLLRDFEFVRLPPEDIVAHGISSTFLPHGLGHLLGLQVHDVGGFMASPRGDLIPKPEGHPYLRNTRVLKENFVTTIEPGLYFIPSLLDKLKAGAHGRNVNWSKVEEFHKYGGIRIEDNVVAKNGSPENLTRDAFKLN